MRCPLCESPMQVRFATRGPNTGQTFWSCSRYPQCRGLRDADGNVPSPRKPREARTPRKSTASAAGPRSRSLARGDLLVSSQNTLGPGKLVARDGELLVLEYFDSPGQAPDERYREAVTRVSLSRLTLSPELRVFWTDAQNRWRSGRVLETNQHHDIYVRGHEWEGFVAEAHLHVRWDKPLVDPVGFGEVGMLESPLLAELRLPFLQSILEQRSASHGMRAALSSSIELHSHQVETAWRVLQDPVQRYLLADEVGLGKTVEAGIVIRQLLLDKPDLTLQLILPPFLIEQWRRELTQKFRIDEFRHATIRFGRDDDPASWRPADLVVVDEAHNLARMSASNDPLLNARFEGLRRVALASPRLLMLSATPALHNVDAFLAMLRMLDPAVYATTTPDQLRERLEARADLGRVFLGLQPSLPGVLLKSRLTQIEAAYPDDADVAEIVEQTRDAISRQDKPEVASQIHALRTHVAEVYRVHRRMLRTRRTAAFEGTYRVSGRRAPESINLDSSSSDDVTDALERWREQALAVAEGDAAAMTSTARAFADAVALTLDPDALRVWATARAASTTSTAERAALQRVHADLGFGDRRGTVSGPFADGLTDLMTLKERAVVFCPTAALGEEVAKELEARLGSATVFRHLHTAPSDRNEGAVRSFEAARRAAVLVADSSAEEGRNLQFADVLVHLGLPSRANRLEQRIGRCDRWTPDGATQWRSYTVSSSAQRTYADAWAQVLADGFGVFEASIASLQRAVDVATDVAWTMLLERGLEGTAAAITRVRELLTTEMERVREQDALDSLEATSNDRSVYARVAAVESRAADFAEVCDALLTANRVPGNLRFYRTGDPVTSTGGYEVMGHLPGRQAQVPLIPATRLLRDFVPLKGHRGSFVREVAIQQEGVRLFRFGDQFIDAISDFLWHDDRGRAFGMWRWLPEWERHDTPVYRFDYAVEANPLEVPTAGDPRGALRSLSADFDHLALARRADGIFPPIIVSVWMTAEGHELNSKLLLDALRAPYVKANDAITGGDFSLNRKRIEHAYELIPAESWGDSWRHVERAAQRLVRDRDDVLTAVQRASATATQDAETRLRQLRLRAARSSRPEAAVLEDEIRREEVVARAMATAVATPSLRLDSTGLVVISGRPLWADA